MNRFDINRHRVEMGLEMMTIQEFETAFNRLWRDKYSTVIPGVDSDAVMEQDDVERLERFQSAIEYARYVSEAGTPKDGKHLARTVFRDLGTSPRKLVFETPKMEPVIADFIRLPAAISDEPRHINGSRIMYIERKADSLMGEARIGRVHCSKSGRTLYYWGLSFRPVQGYKYNHRCVETQEPYWISGCRHDGWDRLYGERIPIYIDDDVREEYWTAIRRAPERKDEGVAP
jgi:hypothetical protein